MSDLVEALGLKVYSGTYESYKGDIVTYYKDAQIVLVCDLQEALEKLPVVYANSMKEIWTEDLGVTDRFQSRLLCIEEIKKEPLKEDFIQFIPENNETHLMIRQNFAGKKVRITVEEIKE